MEQHVKTLQDIEEMIVELMETASKTIAEIAKLDAADLDKCNTNSEIYINTISDIQRKIREILPNLPDPNILFQVTSYSKKKRVGNNTLKSSKYS